MYFSVIHKSDQRLYILLNIYSEVCRVFEHLYMKEKVINTLYELDNATIFLEEVPGRVIIGILAMAIILRVI